MVRSSLLLRRVAPLFALAAASVAHAQVSGWGANSASQLLGSSASYATPIAIASIADAKSFAAGASHVLAVKPNGTVVAFGDNSANQCGVATSFAPVTAATIVAGLPTIASVTGGDTTSYALATDGTLYGWGTGLWGELGNSKDAFNDADGHYPAAFAIPGGTAVVKAFSGRSTLAIIKSDGTVWVAGYNSEYNLGLGNYANRNVLTQNADLTGAKSIAIGGDHGIAAMADGSIKTWGGLIAGYSATGATGSGATLTTPTTLPGLTGVAQVAANGNASYARTNDGKLYSWGYSQYGELGLDSINSTLIPTQIPGLPAIADVQARGESVYALGTDGSVWAWGAQIGLGNGATSNAFSPVRVTGIPTSSRIAAGRGFGLSQSVVATARLTGFTLSSASVHGYSNARVRVTLDNPAGPGGSVINLQSREVGVSLPNGLANVPNSALTVEGLPSPAPSAQRLWRVRNRTALTRSFEFWVFLTGVGVSGSVPPNSDTYFVTKTTWSPLGVLFENNCAVALTFTSCATGPTPLNLFAHLAIPATVTVPEGATSYEFDVFANEVPIESRVEIVASKGTDTFTKILTVQKQSDRPNP